MSAQRTDLFVGLFLVASAALVVAALVATSGWGVDRYEIFVKTDNARDIAVDTKIFMQGLEVGRVAGISPRPTGGSGRLEFVIRLSLLDRFPDGTPLRLPHGTDAEAVQTSPIGGSIVQLTVHADSGGTLGPGDTIELHRPASALEAFGDLASGLKGTIEATLVATTQTLNSARHLADSLTLATGTTRRFIAGIQPGTEKVMAGVAANLDRLRLIMDSTNQRTGLTFQQVNAAIAQTRRLIVDVDTLTRTLVDMGGENRPEIHRLVINMRQLSQQLQYVLAQVGQRPMRLITGVKMPDSLTPPPPRRDSVRATAAGRDSVRSDPPPRDSVRHPEPGP